MDVGIEIFKYRCSSGGIGSCFYVVNVGNDDLIDSS
jgi:hypothetical protein